ncbi:MAG: HEPN domain-containing protein [Thermodesulfovibrionales bacterium]|jgi:HEPN domain-containing protein
MSGPEEAKGLLIMAGKDLIALKNMMNAEAFPEEIFGFHAQQSVEKTLKAWIAALGEEYPVKHDLRLLLIQLEDLKCDVTELWDFVDLNAFAVQFRYAEYGFTEEPLDRQGITAKTQALYDKLQGLIEK